MSLTWRSSNTVKPFNESRSAAIHQRSRGLRLKGSAHPRIQGRGISGSPSQRRKTLASSSAAMCWGRLLMELRVWLSLSHYPIFRPAGRDCTSVSRPARKPAAGRIACPTIAIRILKSSSTLFRRSRQRRSREHPAEAHGLDSRRWHDHHRALLLDRLV